MVVFALLVIALAISIWLSSEYYEYYKERSFMDIDEHPFWTFLSIVLIVILFFYLLIGIIINIETNIGRIEIEEKMNSIAWQIENSDYNNIGIYELNKDIIEWNANVKFLNKYAKDIICIGFFYPDWLADLPTFELQK